MSKVELIRCDACGIIRGEDGRGEHSWTEINLATRFGEMPSSLGHLSYRRHYCLNCWAQIDKTLPKLPERPTAPKG